MQFPSYLHLKNNILNNNKRTTPSTNLFGNIPENNNPIACQQPKLSNINNLNNSTPLGILIL